MIPVNAAPPPPPDNRWRYEDYLVSAILILVLANFVLAILCRLGVIK